MAARAFLFGVFFAKPFILGCFLNGFCQRINSNYAIKKNNEKIMIVMKERAQDKVERERKGEKGNEKGHKGRCVRSCDLEVESFDFIQ